MPGPTHYYTGALVACQGKDSQNWRDKATNWPAGVTCGKCQTIVTAQFNAFPQAHSGFDFRSNDFQPNVKPAGKRPTSRELMVGGAR